MSLVHDAEPELLRRLSPRERARLLRDLEAASRAFQLLGQIRPELLPLNTAVRNLLQELQRQPQPPSWFARLAWWRRRPPA